MPHEPVRHPYCSGNGQDPRDFDHFQEHLCGLTMNTSAQQILDRLGQPSELSALEHWGLDEACHQTWTYSNLGLTLSVGFDCADPKNFEEATVDYFRVTAPSPLRTSTGVGIGSTLADLRKAYGPCEGHDGNDDGKTFLAGSIYGGIIFHLDERGRVREIFVGASAE